jgi:hypothetical protein
MEDSLLVSLIGPGLVIGYIFLGVAVISSIGMPIISAIKNPAGLIKSLIGVVGLVVLFVVAYALSGSEVTTKMSAYGVDAASSKLIGAGLIMFYVALLIAAVLAVLSLVRDIINN